MFGLAWGMVECYIVTPSIKTWVQICNFMFLIQSECTSTTHCKNYLGVTSHVENLFYFCDCLQKGSHSYSSRPTPKVQSPSWCRSPVCWLWRCRDVHSKIIESNQASGWNVKERVVIDFCTIGWTSHRKRASQKIGPQIVTCAWAVQADCVPGIDLRIWFMDRRGLEILVFIDNLQNRWRNQVWQDHLSMRQF